MTMGIVMLDLLAQKQPVLIGFVVGGDE